MGKIYYVDRNHPEYGIVDNEQLLKALSQNGDSDILKFSVEELLSVFGASSKSETHQATKSTGDDALIANVTGEIVSVDDKYLTYDYIVFSDGGATPSSGGVGGYGSVIINCETGDVSEINKSYKATTNNRMEMLGAINGLNSVPDNAKVILITDSQYVVNTMELGWKRNKNQDLWEVLDAAVANKSSVKFLHVKGHGKSDTFESKWNNRCDELSNIAREKLSPIDDVGYEG